MKYIKKNEEPEIFRDWKALANEDWQPNWDENFQSPEKPAVHRSLLREQGSICCYCGREITRETSHIEHLKPRSLYPDLALNYSNLLASCQGESTEPLGLNINKLQTLRKNAIDGVLLAVEGLTEEEILQFSRAYREFDSNNEYRPFCTAIAYILDRYFST
ncbi:MAG: retron system putative HNH endonuclease [Spirulina sp.]